MLKVYYANINDIENEKIFHEKLVQVKTVRQQKVLRCKRRDDQLRSLAAGLLIRHAVEEELLSYKELEFETNSNGKLLINQSVCPVWISISHSGEFAAVAISNHKIGIDLQQQKELKSQDRMKKMCYNDAELDSRESFFYHWTRKEAYSKMLGLGMKLNFKEIDTTSGENYWTKRIEGDYWLSVASNHPVKDLSLNRISLV